MEFLVCLGEPMIALRPVFMACLGLISWPGCDCLWLSLGPLYDDRPKRSV